MSKITFEGTRKELYAFVKAMHEAGICPPNDSHYCEESADTNCITCLKRYIKFIPAPRWRAEKGDKYRYVISTGRVTDGIELGYEIDDARYKAGNYYETEEQAEAATERVRAAYVEEN